MTDQTKKIDMVSASYSAIMEIYDGNVDEPRTKIEQILTKLVDEAYGADRDGLYHSQGKDCCYLSPCGCVCHMPNNEPKFRCKGDSSCHMNQAARSVVCTTKCCKHCK